MNSRQKGKVGEREFAALLREHGFDARRGQQFSGSPDSPDVVSDALAWLHVEVKRVQNLNLTDACAQAEGGRSPPCALAPLSSALSLPPARLRLRGPCLYRVPSPASGVSKVTKLDYDMNEGGGMTTYNPNTGIHIPGAGVSTCASFVPPG